MSDWIERIGQPRATAAKEARAPGAPRRGPAVADTGGKRRRGVVAIAAAGAWRPHAVVELDSLALDFTFRRLEPDARVPTIYDRLDDPAIDWVYCCADPDDEWRKLPGPEEYREGRRWSTSAGPGRAALETRPAPGGPAVLLDWGLPATDWGIGGGAGRKVRR